MEKDKIFVGETGITDTKASRIADYSKLAYTELETELQSLSFINEKVETINGQYAKDIKFGATSLDDIPAKIERIGQLKTLNAWLREAVKAHQNLITEASRLTVNHYAKLNNIELPVYPTSEPVLTEADVLATFDIKKRNRYYALEAHAATVGEFVHKDMAIDKARKKMYDKMNNPRMASGSGNDTLIYSYEPSVSKEDVEKLFYTLQQTQAKYQSELNSLKSEIKSRITNDTIDKQHAYDKAYAEASAMDNDIRNKFLVWRTEEQKRVAGLKIVIPNSLKDIYEEISQLGN